MDAQDLTPAHMGIQMIVTDDVDLTTNILLQAIKIPHEHTEPEQSDIMISTVTTQDS